MNPREVTLGLIFTSLKQQHTFKNVNYCLNTNIYPYLETSVGQSSNLYLNVDYFFSARVN